MTDSKTVAGTATVFAELSHFGLLQFSGDDARAFLHGQLSCDVNCIPALAAQYGSYNTPQGRMLATFVLLRSGAECSMLLPAELLAAVQKRLSMYILRAKVKVRDASGECVRIGVAGAGSDALIRSAIGSAPVQPWQVHNAGAATALRLPGDRYQLWLPVSAAADFWRSLRTTATPVGAACWDYLEIVNGMPWITAATQDAFVPQMANLDLIGGVSFSKGCYPGQEIVARTQYLGQLKRRMYLAQLSAPQPVHAGTALYSAAFGEQACGTVVNAAPAPDGHQVVLAVMQIATADCGEVHAAAPAGAPLQILSLPYAIAGAARPH
jgi:folate-binding protein YgfZ